MQLASALLYMWSAIASLQTYDWVLPLAAELALHVLAGPEGGGLASDPSHPVHSQAIQYAAIAIQVVGCCLDAWRDAAEEAQQAGPAFARVPTRAEAALVSDTVQKAIVLHCCAFVRAWRGEQQRKQQPAAGAGGRRRSGSTSSSGSGSGCSWAPTEATNMLQQLAFPLDAVQLYTGAVCAAYCHTLWQQTLIAHQCLQSNVQLRAGALRVPGWAQRYRGVMAAAAAGPSAGPMGEDLIAHLIVGPDFNVAQLAYLGIEFVAVTGFGSDPERVESAVVGLQLTSTMLVLTVGQYIGQVLVPEARSERERYTVGCLEYLRSSMGQQLLKAAGVAEADLEGDGSQLSGAGGGP